MTSIGGDIQYAEAVVEHLMEILIDLDALRGTGAALLAVKLRSSFVPIDAIPTRPSAATKT